MLQARSELIVERKRERKTGVAEDQLLRTLRHGTLCATTHILPSALQRGQYAVYQAGI